MEHGAFLVEIGTFAVLGNFRLNILYMAFAELLGLWLVIRSHRSIARSGVTN